MMIMVLGVFVWRVLNLILCFKVFRLFSHTFSRMLIFTNDAIRFGYRVGFGGGGGGCGELGLVYYFTIRTTTLILRRIIHIYMSVTKPYKFIRMFVPIYTITTEV
jgi:hypothetical protein